MLKNNYYYLVSGLADLSLEQNKLPHSVSEFKLVLKNHLPDSDYRYVELLFLDIDNINILNILENKKNNFTEGGKYTFDELEQSLKEPLLEEEYLNRFIKAYTSETPIIAGMLWEDQLSSLYYEHIASSPGNEFLKTYFEFDLNAKNILSALNIRKHNITQFNLLIGNNFVAKALESTGLRDFGISGEFTQIERFLTIFENKDIISRELSLDQMRWTYMDELNTFNYFTIEVLLSYVIKLRIIEHWLKLDEEEGKKMFDSMIDSFNQSFEFTKEFTIHERRKN